MRVFRILALALFVAYLAVFPGSTLTVALDGVPTWGEALGGALLILQGAAVLCWLAGMHGWRGAGVGILLFVLAWGVEFVGVTTGFPFGSYSYTPLLQPQLFGSVPLAIACAWPMVALGAWQLAAGNVQTFKRSNVRTLMVAATLVLLLDLQIETVATQINAYWVWHDQGHYYGVPAANFIAWWLVGLAMAWLVSNLLSDSWSWQSSQESGAWIYEGEVPLQGNNMLRITHYALRRLPAAMYVLSTVMFVAMNLARGYALAGLVGLVVLIALASRLTPRLGAFVLVRPRDVSEAE